MVWSPDDLERAYKEHVAKTAGTPAPGPTRPAPAEPLNEQIESELGDLAPPGCDNGYVLAGVESQIVALAGAAPGERNTALFISAKALGRLAEVERAWLRKKLKTACELNGLSADDGIGQVTKTIRSGFAAADHAGERVIPDGPGYFVTVTEVPISAFNLAGSSNGAGTQLGNVVTLPSARCRLEAVMARIVAAEGDFWERPSLQRIFTAALMQMVPPHALLAQCAARALALVPATVRLPGAVGGVRGGSLNWFAAVVAESGMGKSSAQDLAEELVPGWHESSTLIDHPVERNVGSGEGIVQAYVRRHARAATTRSPAVQALHHSEILFYADEVDSLTANAHRQGSTTLPILRQAFTGGTLGFAYAKSTNNTHLPKHTYRLIFVLSGQPEKYGPLLADRVGGTPQRFQWFPAFDLRIVEVPQNTISITALPLPGIGDWKGQTVLEIPAEAKSLIRSTKVSVSRGEAGELGSHEIFVREKFAQALAVLDGRVIMSDDDWRRAGQAADVSRVTRDWVQGQIAGAEELEDTTAGRRRGVLIDATELEKARRQGVRKQAQIDQIADWVRGKLAGGSMPLSELVHAQRYDKRPLTTAVVKALIDEGHLEAREVNGVDKVRLSKLGKTRGPGDRGPVGE